MSDLDLTFSALADPTRRKVIDLLRKRPCPSGELARAFGLSPPAMSRHLRALRQSGLVEEEHGGDDARVRVYRLRREPFGELRGWLDEVEAFWSAELHSFKAHAERRSALGTRHAEPAKSAGRSPPAASTSPGASSEDADAHAERGRAPR